MIAVCNGNARICILVLTVWTFAGLFLSITQVAPALGAPSGGKGRMGGGGGPMMVMESPAKKAQEIAEKLRLTDNQKIEVVYLLEAMFTKQAEYRKQMRDSSNTDREEAMAEMQRISDQTIALVGDFLNDRQFEQLAELLKPGERGSEGARSGRPG